MSAPEGRTITVGLVKAAPPRGQPERSLEILADVTAGLEPGGLDVLVTPECFLDGYMAAGRDKCRMEDLAACSMTGPDDARVKRAAEVASRLGCWLVLGASERSRDGRLYNVAYLLDRSGGHVGTYRKVHPCRLYAPGDELPVFETDFGRVGIVICADRRWPENIRCLRLAGAEVILNPTWGFRGELNTAIMRTRAYENGVWVCFAHPHESLICGPDGSVAAAEESSTPGVLVHKLDLARNVDPHAVPDDASSASPIRARRPELYGPMTRTSPPV
ncbi:MAG TPA: carbon-nitrogen hydrolase family protein [Phycisphaerae bacterium]|nr:carbon-nitrogen hydrolase family protein [Phycisphaerae bacterium]